MRNDDKHIEIDRLISLYLSGEIDNKSIVELNEWCKESAENTLYVRNQMEIWFSSSVIGSNNAFDKEDAFLRFQRRVQESEQALQKTIEINKNGKHSWKIVYRVAAILLIIILPLIGYWGGVETIKNGFSDIVVEAPLGARTKLFLPDGTMVWLNAGSRISYSQGFGVDDRHLNLSGEGYFEVTKNKNLPFEISTNDLSLFLNHHIILNRVRI